MEKLKKYDKTKKYVVAVSGGPDSMALLYMLRKEKFNLIVAHVNYKKRKESDEEQEMVESFCRANNIPIYVSIYKATNPSDKSFQVLAREYRYDFFKKVYDENNCSGLFVAHQKDDLIETYLLKKQRNVINISYIINEYSLIKGMNVYRPLLNYYKDELLQFCIDNNISYRIDKSNFSSIYPRNVIRKQISNQDKNKLFLEALAEENKLIEINKEVLLFIKANKYYKIVDLTDKNNTFLQLFLYNLIDDKYKKNVNKSLLEKLKSFLSSKKANLKHKIDDEYYLIKSYDQISFKKIIDDEGFCYIVNDMSCFETPFFKVFSKGYKMQGIFLTEEDFPIKIRSYHQDDVVEIKNGKKKVSRLFIDKKIPLIERKFIPIIENKDGKILFVYGIYRHFNFKLTQNNYFVLKY